MDPHSAPSLSWRDGKTPVSEQFQDPYYSVHNGAAEAAHVFLAGNDLPARFRDGFSIAELGFGTGLNLAVTLGHWAGAGRFSYTSFEAFPMAPPDIMQALAPWPEYTQTARAISDARAAQKTEFSIGPADVTLVLGDARQTIHAWEGRADAWFLDGFSPARNPELWEPALLQAVADHTALGGSFATYTAAGDVRRGLEAAGFEVTRTPGFGTKRHMSRGVLR